MLYSSLTKEELSAEFDAVKEKYEAFKARKLDLNMARGKPGKVQLDLADELFKDVNASCDYIAADGTDCRNYGILDGIKECKAIFAEALGVEEKNVIVCGNSSLNLMYDYIAQCMTHGAGAEPWLVQGGIKFACPAPGYDRHFSVLEHFGIEMVTVPMTENGPDMAVVEELVKDEKVKGMFCVPKYSNPQGYTYSDETVKAIAALKPAAKDFRVIWDNAYFAHDINDEGDCLLNIFDAAKQFGTEDNFIEVASTSKVTFPGAGVSVIIASDNNIAAIKKRMSAQTIGYDKMNMLRHARVIKNADGLKEIMKKHAAILKPKFDIVLQTLENELGDCGIASWTNPNGGYFVSLDVADGCAKRVVELCKNGGVTLTGAGATFPYGKDPKDSNIRIAPSFPEVDELKEAMTLLCLAVKYAALEKAL